MPWEHGCEIERWSIPITLDREFHQFVCWYAASHHLSSDNCSANDTCFSGTGGVATIGRGGTASVGQEVIFTLTVALMTCSIRADGRARNDCSDVVVVA